MHQQFSSYDFVPKSIIHNLNNNTDNLSLFVEQLRKKNQLEYFIIKPVFGSRGKGITVINPNYPIEIFINSMNLAKNDYGYTVFVVSVYINNPKLYQNITGFNKGSKFNLRFYALLNINKLPTYSDLKYDIKFYLLKDVQAYFAVLPYKIKLENITETLIKICKCNTYEHPSLIKKLASLRVADIEKIIHITNLQIVKDLSKKLLIDIPLKDFVKTLDMMNYDKNLKNSIIHQGTEIIKKTLDHVKYDIRPLNRFVPKSSAFNLLAYDTMLDTDNKLHLIEINRGPDLNGLKITLGDDKIQNIFSEIFDIIVDKKMINLFILMNIKFCFNKNNHLQNLIHHFLYLSMNCHQYCYIL